MYLGIDVGATSVKIGYEGCSEYNFYPTGLDFSPEELIKVINQYKLENNLQIDGIGISFAGICRGELVERAANLPKLIGFDMNTLKDLGITPKVDLLNDGKSFTLGVARNYPKNITVATIVVGTGIGAGCCVNGDIFLGNGEASDLHGTKIILNDEIISIGTLCSGKSILKRTNLTPEKITEKILKGNKKITKIMNDVALYLALLGMNVISNFAPHVLVYGGGVLEYPNVFENITEVLNLNCGSVIRDVVKVYCNAGSENCILGAIEYVKKK